MDWLDLLAVQGTLKNLLQHHSSKASILWCSAVFIVQLSHPYMTTGKTIALTRRTFVDKVMPLLLNMLSRLVITFLSRSKHLLISWLQSPSAVILEPREIKSATVSPSIMWMFQECGSLVENLVLRRYHWNGKGNETSKIGIADIATVSYKCHEYHFLPTFQDQLLEWVVGQWWWWFSHSVVTPCTVARQAPLSIGFPRQEYWSGLPFPSPGDLPDPGIEPVFLALAGRFLTVEPLGKPSWPIDSYFLMSQISSVNP